MKRGRLITGIVLVLIFIVALVFVIHSVKHGLPEEGEWKGNIHQWKPHYAGEGLVITLVGIVGTLFFLIGIWLTVVALREDAWRL